MLTPQHLVGLRWQVDKPADFSPSAVFLHDEMTKGFERVTSRLDTQNSRIRKNEVAIAMIKGGIAVVALGVPILTALIVKTFVT